MGPFKLEEAQGDNTFKLDFPDHLNASKTRNFMDFKRNQVDSTRAQDPPPPIRVVKKTGDAEYEIERIASWKKEDGKALFEVKWFGYDITENTFEPYTNITRYGSKAMFTKFVKEMDDPELSKLLPKTFRPKPKPKPRKTK